MTKAEQRALEAYNDMFHNPEKMSVRSTCSLEEAEEMGFDYKEPFKNFFMLVYQQGYSQAEKDIKEWIEEQLTILDRQTLLHPDDDVFWGQRNAYKQIKDKLNSL